MPLHVEINRGKNHGNFAYSRLLSPSGQLIYPATTGCFSSANEGDIPDLSLFMKVTSSISLFKSVPFRESKPSQAVHPHDYRLAPWPPAGLHTQLPVASLARRCSHYGRQDLHKCWEGRAGTLPCSCRL